MGQGLKWAKSQNGPGVKMVQESKLAKSQNGPKVNMGQRFEIGYCCLPPKRVELTLHSKKEKMVGLK